MEYVRVIKRRWWFLLLASVVAVTAAVVTAPRGRAATSSGPTQYRASHILQASGTSSALISTQQALSSAELLLTAGEVPKRAAAKLDLNSDASQLASKIRVTTDPKSATVSVIATSPDAKEVVAFADTLANELVTYLNDRDTARYRSQVDGLNAQVKDLGRQISTLDAKIQQDIKSLPPNLRATDVDGALRAQRDGLARQLSNETAQVASLTANGPPAPEFQTLENASASAVSSRSFFQPPKSHTVRSLIALVLALLVSGGLLVVIERLDPRIKTRAAAESAFGLPVLAGIHLLCRGDCAGPPPFWPGHGQAQQPRSLTGCSARRFSFRQLCRGCFHLLARRHSSSRTENTTVSFSAFSIRPPAQIAT